MCIHIDIYYIYIYIYINEREGEIKETFISYYYFFHPLLMFNEYKRGISVLSYILHIPVEVKLSQSIAHPIQHNCPRMNKRNKMCDSLQNNLLSKVPTVMYELIQNILLERRPKLFEYCLGIKKHGGTNEALVHL